MSFEPSKSQRIVLECKDKNILVSASAGTGKTTVMIEKISGLITSGQATLKELLVVTFTEMAAYEMKNRLVKNLSQSNDTKILAQLGQIDTCNISTVHSFCSALIRRYFVEAEVDPAYKILTDTEWKIAYDKVLDDLFEELYLENDEDFLGLVDIFGKKRRDDGLKNLVKKIYSFKVGKHNFDCWVEKHKKQYQFDENGQNFFLTQFNTVAADEFHNIKQRCDSLAAEAKKLGIECLVNYFSETSNNLYVSKNKPLSLNFDEIANFSMKVWPTKTIKKQVENQAQELFAERAKEEKDKLNANAKIYSNFLKKFSCYDELVWGIGFSCEMCTKVFDLVQKFQNAFDEYKAKNGCLDFNDLEHKALKVLSVPKARNEIKQNFKFVFVDEYQDINEIQEEIISLVKGENNLFVVGDVKQGIYAFRQCTPDIFVEKLNSYKNDEKHLVAYLNENYRSHKQVLDFVNFVFARLMTTDFGGIDYKTTSMLDSPMQSKADKTMLNAINIDVVVNDSKKNKDQNKNAEIIEPYLPKNVNLQSQDKEGCEMISKQSNNSVDLHKAEANIIAQRIREIIGLKMQIGGKEKTITYGDIVLLSRGMNPGTKKIVSHLQSLGFPVVYTAKQNLIDSTEIKQLVNLFKLADNPYDDVSTFACLTGFFCGVCDDDVAQVFINTKAKCHNGSKMPKTAVERVADYCQANDNALSRRLQAFLDFLNKVTFLSKHLTVTQLVAKLFAETDYVLKVLGLPDGEMRFKKINDFLISLENKNYNKNVSEFLHFINSVADEEVDVESSSQVNAIRVMTIHKSKGLEFPVVFVINCGQAFRIDTDAVLCDKKHGFSSGAFDVKTRTKKDTVSNFLLQQSAKIDKVEEEMRLLYVAMTRATSHLYLTGCINNADDEKESEKGMKYFDWILSCIANSEYAENNCVFHDASSVGDQGNAQSRQSPDFSKYNNLDVQRMVQQIKTQLMQKYYTKSLREI